MLGGFGFGEKWKTGALALSCVVGNLREAKGRIGKLCAFFVVTFESPLEEEEKVVDFLEFRRKQSPA